MTEALALLLDHLRDPAHAWSIGTYGAIAEFTRDPGEADTETFTGSGAKVATPRGAIAISLDAPVILTEYESRGHHGGASVRTVMACLPTADAQRAARTTITETGPDDDAIAGQGILFDMGLGVPHVDIFVRTGDAALQAELHKHLGKSILDPDNPAMAVIKEASPHRVFASRLGRIEVLQQIGSTARGVPTPEGPHTHVLPKLLRLNRTHARNAPVPEGMVPALNLYPAH